MPITGDGWELFVERLRLHRRGNLARTYGRYVVSIGGHPQPGLSGYMVEAIGPGDNSAADNGRRIAAGRYELTTHFRTFVSAGYSTSTDIVADPPMPAIRLLGTGKRTGILIHPVYPPETKLYLASVGCLNPTSDVPEDASIDFWDSRQRVIALLELAARLPAGGIRGQCADTDRRRRGHHRRRTLTRFAPIAKLNGACRKPRDNAWVICRRGWLARLRQYVAGPMCGAGHEANGDSNGTHGKSAKNCDHRRRLRRPRGGQ